MRFPENPERYKQRKDEQGGIFEREKCQRRGNDRSVPKARFIFLAIQCHAAKTYTRKDDEKPMRCKVVIGKNY